MQGGGYSLLTWGRQRPLDGISQALPGFKASGKRADAPDALSPQQQRHTGAGGFVGSGAVEHDVAVARYFFVALLEILRPHAPSAGNPGAIAAELARVAQINNGDLFP
jgi:hypothetical protein